MQHDNDALSFSGHRADHSFEYFAEPVQYPMWGHRAKWKVQPKCEEAGIGILAYSPLAQGLLTRKFRTPQDVSEGRARTRHFSSERAQVRHGEAGHEAATFAAIDAIRTISDEIDAPMAEVALAWCLHQPGVTSVLAGARNPAQIKENAAAGERQLEASIVQRLNDATEELKQRLGPNIDLWQNAQNARAR